ncbi:MAG: hypothetical protein ACLFQK_09575 [Fibrobacterota bacterium]
MRSATKTIFVLSIVSILSFMLIGCSGGCEWAEGTWEAGMDKFSIEKGGVLNYSKAGLKDIKPKSAGGDKVTWQAKSMLGEADITLQKISDTEAKLITKIGGMSDESTYKKK